VGGRPRDLGGREAKPSGAAGALRVPDRGAAPPRLPAAHVDQRPYAFNAACAAGSRAIGTRNGEHDT
jgi:hypothetical protein